MKAIMTTYHGPTNTRGSRYSATDSDGNKVTMSQDDRYGPQDNARAAARMLCAKMGWHGVLVEGWIPSGYVYVFKTVRYPESEFDTDTIDTDTVADSARAIVASRGHEDCTCMSCMTDEEVGQ